MVGEHEDMDLETVCGNIGLGKKAISNIKALAREDMERILSSWDYKALAGRCKISKERSKLLLNALKGSMPNHNFFATPRVEAIYNMIIDQIKPYCRTQYSKNFVECLYPMATLDRALERQEWVMDCAAKASSLSDDDRRALDRLYKDLRTFNTDIRNRHISRYVVIVDAEEDYETLRALGVTRYADVYTPDYVPEAPAGIIIYAYSQGTLPIESLDGSGMGVVRTSISSVHHAWDLLPELVDAIFLSNRNSLRSAVEIGTILNIDTHASAKALELIRECGGGAITPLEDIAGAIEEWCHRLNDTMEGEIEGKKLDAKDILAALRDGKSAFVEEISKQIIERELPKLKENLPPQVLSPLPITRTYPFRLDEETLRENYRNYEMDAMLSNYYDARNRAGRLRALIPEINDEFKGLISTELELALGRFVTDFRLRPFTTSTEGVRLRAMRHMELIARGTCTPVDYHFGEGGERVIILTGANSGGKTTLLETIAQIYIMAYMGLPVPAEHAALEEIEAIVFYTHTRALGAGAFENFLRNFLPLCTTESKTLILADEIEAMTELDASARIIATFIEELKNKDSIGIIVSHLAEEILRYTKVRIDGIEAEGLDENYELIVTRSPRINHRARSMPELILQRLRRQWETEGKRDLIRVIDQVLNSSDERR